MTHKTDGDQRQKKEGKAKERKNTHTKTGNQKARNEKRQEETAQQAKNEERANISGESKPGYDAILDAPGYIQPGGYSHVMGLIRQSLTERPNGGGVS